MTSPTLPRSLFLVVLSLSLTGSLALSACTEERPAYPRIVVGSDDNQSASNRPSASDPDARPTEETNGDARGDSSAVCTFTNFSSASSGFGCVTTENYSCMGNPVTITCDCETSFLCSCGAITTPANCATPCGGADENVRAQCGVDARRPNGSDGGFDASFLD